MDITELYVLQEADTPNAAGRHVCVRAVPGVWWEHPFWTNLAQSTPKAI